MRSLFIFILLALGLKAQQLEVFVSQSLMNAVRVGSIRLSGENVRCVAIRDVPKGWALSLKNGGAGEFMLDGNVEYGAAAVAVKQLLSAIVFEKIEAHKPASIKLNMELLNPDTGEFLPDTEFAAKLSERAEPFVRPSQ